MTFFQGSKWPKLVTRISSLPFCHRGALWWGGTPLHYIGPCYTLGDPLFNRCRAAPRKRLFPLPRGCHFACSSNGDQVP